MTSKIGRYIDGIGLFFQAVFWTAVIFLILYTLGGALLQVGENAEYSVSGSDITVFPILCSNAASGFSDCANPKTLSRIAYKVNANNRTVVEWQPDYLAAGIPINYQSYTHCSIVNVSNWSCSNSDGAMTFGFSSGDYFPAESYANNSGGNVLFVSGSQWGSVQKLQNSNSVVTTSTEHSGAGAFPSELASISSLNDQFPMQQIECNAQGCPQYNWYDRHNVGMAYRCYPGSDCTASEWALAVYGNSNDPRGMDLKQQSDVVAQTMTAQYPTGKCVTESDVQICDLSYDSIGKTSANRTVKMQANEIVCRDINTNADTDVQSDTVSINFDPQFCVSDLGSIHIDPTIDVVKHYGAILDNGSAWTLPRSYDTCIWTYNGGSGDIPYIQVGGQIGPDNSYSNVNTFCQNGSNQVDIYTTS